ncbi:MAG: hypothetical protein HeimC2_37180 [Candidatus Heimdallarchaeota archaeon LC_2]|nr:MAG: hypothetical protein HeimC2_37180 [Candidatus Heimdallarchaeota archaeon LC_2]
MLTTIVKLRLVILSAEKITTIETIETIESPGPPEELLKQAEFENENEADIFDDVNEFYLSILYQMCVAA